MNGYGTFVYNADNVNGSIEWTACHIDTGDHKTHMSETEPWPLWRDEGI